MQDGWWNGDALPLQSSPDRHTCARSPAYCTAQALLGAVPSSSNPATPATSAECLTCGASPHLHSRRHCREQYPPGVRHVLWLMAEMAIIGSDIQEVGALFCVGGCMRLLSAMPFLGGACIIGSDIQEVGAVFVESSPVQSSLTAWCQPTGGPTFMRLRL